MFLEMVTFSPHMFAPLSLIFTWSLYIISSSPPPHPLFYSYPISSPLSSPLLISHLFILHLLPFHLLFSSLFIFPLLSYLLSCSVCFGSLDGSLGFHVSGRHVRTQTLEPHLATHILSFHILKTDGDLTFLICLPSFKIYRKHATLMIILNFFLLPSRIILTFRFAKTLRIFIIIKSGLRRIKVTAAQVLSFTGFWYASLIIYLIFNTVFAPSQVLDSISVAINGQATRSLSCTTDKPALQTVLYSWEGAFLGGSALLCYATKDVPDAINEAKVIALGESCN